jgi:hypothetical protein
MKMSKRTTSSVTSINIKTLSAADRLHGTVRFRYSLDGKPVEHTVYLMQTDCHYGAFGIGLAASIASGA